MNKTATLILCLVLVFSFACKRTAVEDPDVSPVTTFEYVVEGSANPSIIEVYGDGYTRDTCEIVIKVSDNVGNPVTGRTVYLEQFHMEDFELGLFSRVDYGFFDGDTTAITAIRTTNALGIVKLVYWGPLTIGSQYGVVLRAMIAKDEQTQEDVTQPYDYIHITFFDARD